MKSVDRLLLAFMSIGLVGHANATPIVPNITEYWTNVNSVAREVTFSVLYDGPPDFSTIVGMREDDPSYDYQQILQFNVDPNSTISGAGAGGGHTVTPEMRTLACDATNNIPGASTCWEFAFSVHNLDGIILSTIGALPFTVIGNLFQLSAPFDLLNLGSTGSFTYSIEDGAPNTSVRNVFFGTGGQRHIVGEGAVPEPATLVLFGIGLAGLGWSARKRT